MVSRGEGWGHKCGQLQMWSPAGSGPNVVKKWAAVKSRQIHHLSPPDRVKEANTCHLNAQVADEKNIEGEAGQGLPLKSAHMQLQPAGSQAGSVHQHHTLHPQSTRSPHSKLQSINTVCAPVPAPHCTLHSQKQAQAGRQCTQ